ncbi:MAG: DUF2812 domain-containing protein [Oscillospiraceae bacterium]|jgi:hypothetical protein|nr:DUF2812 domain-containing protein [Oscillospiraceae bacterium]
MRVKAKKWFWAWQFDKEEKWLNEMAARGLNLIAVGFNTYYFEEGLPGEYTVRMEMLNSWPGSAVSRQYIRFVEDTGAECVGTFLRWAFFRKKTELGKFDLFSDVDSRIAHVSRILLLCGIVSLLMAYNIVNMTFQYLEYQNFFMAFVGGFCVVMEVLMIFGIGRLWRMLRKLKKDRTLHE